jgi:small multidrug resistance pump
MPVGTAYAIWSSLGIVLVVTAEQVLHRSGIDFATMVGLGLVVSGCLVLNLLSSTIAQ